MLSFTKMHGLGNDFLIIDAIARPVNLSPELVREMADRHTGVGFDQLLLLAPARQAGEDFSYRIFNADGGEVAQCGNGARCAGRYLYEAGYVRKPELILGTRERNLAVRVLADNQVAVNMGPPLFAPEQIPFIASRQSDRYTIEVAGRELVIGTVNLGNPHAVTIVSNVATAEVEFLGPRVQQSKHFPQQVNLGFMECLSRNHIRLRVYERGAGETLACGSGACAAVVIGRLWGLLDAVVQVDLRGGELRVEWPGGEQSVWLTGTTETVFKGEWLKKSC